MDQSTFNVLVWVGLIVLVIFGARRRAKRRANMSLEQRQQEDMLVELRRIRRKLH